MKRDGPKAEDFFAACVCLGLNRAARATSRRYDAALKPLGLTSGQFSILSALMRERPAPIGALAEALGMDRTTLSRNLKPLQAAKLVETRPDPQDARIKGLAATAKGRELLGAALPLWRQAQRDSNKRLGRDRWAALKPLLDGLA
jgi:DNA-binding MarR family transcriptional regulator